VAEAKRERNALACESGWGICDHSASNTDEAKNTLRKQSP
jgi:hypothetical protein